MDASPDGNATDSSIRRLALGWLAAERAQRKNEAVSDADDECWNRLTLLAVKGASEALPIIDVILGLCSDEETEWFEPTLLYPFIWDHVAEVAPTFARHMQSLPHLRRYFLLSLPLSHGPLGEWPRVLMHAILEGADEREVSLLFTLGYSDMDAPSWWTAARSAARSGSQMPSSSWTALRVPKQFDPMFLGTVAALVEVEHSGFEDQLLSTLLFAPSMAVLDSDSAAQLLPILRVSAPLRALVKRTLHYEGAQKHPDGLSIENAVIDLLESGGSLEPG
jgi:hypothetical protein